MSNLLIKNQNDFIISDWLSPDERYCIFLDELYDIKNKKKIGNIWENFETFKFFIRYSTSVSNLSKTIKESIYVSLNNSLITESFDDTFKKHRPLIKKMVSENIFKDFYDWSVEQGKSTIEGFKEFAKETYDGISHLVDKISNAEWSQVFDILRKGIIYFAKKLKSALYHPVGMILEAMLIATGVGKAVQMVPWSIVVALDIYLLFKGDYESLFWHLFETLFDIVGLVFTGGAAKALKLTFKGVKRAEDAAKIIAKNPSTKKIFQKIPDMLKKISPKLQQAMKYLSSKFPKGAYLINSILSKVDDFISKVTQELGKLFSKKGLTTGVFTASLIFGFERLFSPGVELSDEEIQVFANEELDFEGIFY